MRCDVRRLLIAMLATAVVFGGGACVNNGGNGPNATPSGGLGY
jgi:hypothetical protein